MRTRVRTYEELQKRIRAFVDGDMPLLVLYGSPGKGKSKLVEQVLPEEEAVWVRGMSSPFGLFEALRRNPDRPFVLDDLNDALHNRAMITLLKQVCQTSCPRRVTWMSRANARDEDGSQTVETSGKVVLTLNEWESLSPHVQAVGDRGREIEFLPTHEEVHAYIDTWRRKAIRPNGNLHVEPEVFDYIGENLSIPDVLSIRQYENASDDMRQGVDWKATLMQEWSRVKPEHLVKRLADDQRFQREEDRIRRFNEVTGLSRSRYFEIKSDAGLSGNRPRGGARPNAGRKPGLVGL